MYRKVLPAYEREVNHEYVKIPQSRARLRRHSSVCYATCNQHQFWDMQPDAHEGTAAVIKAILVVMLERNSFIVVLENQQIYAASEVWAPELYNTTAVVLTLLHLEKHLSTIRLLFKPCIMYIQPSIFIPLSLMLNSTAFSVQNWPKIAAAFTSFYSTKCLGALWLQCMPCTCDFLGSATWLYQMQVSTSVFKRKKQMCFEFTYMNFQRRII